MRLFLFCYIGFNDAISRMLSFLISLFPYVRYTMFVYISKGAIYKYLLLSQMIGTGWDI